MRVFLHSEKTLSASRENAYLVVRTVVFFFRWLLVSTPIMADSVMALPDGGENIMVTFDELDAATTFPITHRGVTYTLVEGEVIAMWTSPNMPITRFVKAPMLALTTSDEPAGEPATRISLRLDFEKPTQFFGFSLGFNNRTQPPNGSLLPDIGSVVLEFSNGRSQVVPLSASRMLCCTEARFDYSDTDDSIVGNGLVESATITLDYNYEPFAPGSGFPGDYFVLKFMGIDDVTYSTANIPTTMEVAIDIKPRKDPNIINLRSRGFVSLAVLTKNDLDTLQLDPDVARFGPGNAMTARYQVKDVDHDGDEDLLLYFKIQQTGIACQDTQATLTGELYDGTSITGTDSIQTKNCH